MYVSKNAFQRGKTTFPYYKILTWLPVLENYQLSHQQNKLNKNLAIVNTIHKLSCGHYSRQKQANYKAHIYLWTLAYKIHYFFHNIHNKYSKKDNNKW